ncbi:hypothetical protein ZEAMMB73_Zm00001d040851 [Zea mays]|nr:hypothetical protein ZEAMMB73_Zm00001d040851 [Zea mays]
MKPRRTQTDLKFVSSSPHEAFRFCTTGLPSDVTVEVGDMSFHLHKFPLLSKSAFLERSIEENSDQEECIIKLNDIPGVPSHLS